MTSTWTWIAALAIGMLAIILSAAAERPGLHLALAALVCLGFVVLAIWDFQRLLANSANLPALASATARDMGFVWAWAALGMLFTYVFILSWHEWWQYVLAAGVVAALCFFFSASMSRDADSDREDETMLKLARYLTIGQLVGMLITMIGLIVDNKMPRDPQQPDWAANNIFFLGAAALALISANALRSPLPKKS
jgi:hypothetical protein